MKKPQRPCREVNCGNLTRDIWCDIHRKTGEDSRRDMQRVYNKTVRPEHINRFYGSSQWQRVRSLAIERDNHLCQSCLKDGVLEPARVVHHIEEVKDNWNQRLSLDNLESLCHKCHNRHHKRVPRGQ